MTNNNSNNSNRLDRIEQLIESNTRTIQGMLEQQATDRQSREETARIVESNSRTIQGMLEQQATDRLTRQEENTKHQEQMTALRNAIEQLIKMEQGLVNMMAKVDENQPTILRKLNTIEAKIDRLSYGDR